MLAYKMKDLLVDYEWEGKKYTKPLHKIRGAQPLVVVTDVYPAPVELGNLPQAVPTPCYPVECVKPTFTPQYYDIPKVGCVPQQEQGNNPMNYNYTNAATATVIADTSEKDKRQYLASRLSDLRYEKRNETNEMFGLGDIDRPKTPKEALERIQAGKFTIDGLDQTPPPRHFDFYDMFSWRDPSVKQDEEGRDAAFEQLETLHDDLTDIVKVKSLDEAFDTLKALKDWQPTGKAN